MPNYSLLFARTLQDADNSALIDWKWDKIGDLGHDEYRRPDTGERVRFVLDNHGRSLQGLRWNTRIYLGYDWQKRTDAEHIRLLVSEGFFNEVDPELPPPRMRTKRDDALTEIKRSLDRLEKS